VEEVLAFALFPRKAPTLPPEANWSKVYDSSSSSSSSLPTC
jgi:hypothetical protein